MIQDGQLLNYIGGEWRRSRAATLLDVRNPATSETLARVPITPRDEVDAAAQAAHAAFEGWRRTPAPERIQCLFRLKNLLEREIKEIARTITQECGKTLAEAEAEMRRGIENVEVACGIPSLMQGYNNEDIASGIDEHMFRQPIGVVAAITPFNFPGMIPLWFVPYALACGNCFILKPSEKVPLTSARLAQLIDAAGCRGLRKGGAMVSEKHCNFLINTGSATAADIEALGEEVRRRVRDRSGIELIWEIKRIGQPAAMARPAAQANSEEQA